MERPGLHPDPETVRAQAGALFESLSPRLRALLPAAAGIAHIGSTACAGLETTGDLDILVRVPQADFPAADAALAKAFPRDAGSVRTNDFAAFEMPGESMPAGIRLAAIGGAFDHFHLFAAALAAHPALVDGFNEIKRLFEGRPLADYRAAKALFVSAVLDGIARGEITL
ncbi:GrpB family protein [Zhengella sp. ZM62]|uniref:GrpB family protein n=1 Tax=Zhengella sedimenti TaxID=3390035 RepID=UPI003976C4D2